MKKTNGGFTLTELLVAVALMLILIVAVVTIFQQSSEIFSVSEAKMDVFQNTRVAFELMSQELASAQNDSSNFEFLPTPTQNPTRQTILSFSTITSWQDSSGRADVLYELVKSNSGRWHIERTVNDGANQFVGVLTQFIAEENNVPRVNIDYVRFVNNQWQVNRRPNDTEDNLTAGTLKKFDQELLPPAIRITMDVTDRTRRRIVRTISRTFWLATAE